MSFSEQLEAYSKEESFSPHFANLLAGFHKNYMEQLQQYGLDVEKGEQTFQLYLKIFKEQCSQPHKFSSFHPRITSPVDYYKFGLDVIRPLINKKESKLLGIENFKTANEQLEKGHNVIFFSNHQSEADTQILNIQLEEPFPRISEDLIFVAGERVTTDPIAIPFSLGCNLLCISSKRHINIDPSQKAEKQESNKMTMSVMGKLLSEGGRCIYVAPSGGRDRPDQDGYLPIAPFDPKSLDMFLLMSRKSKTPTHFYPLSLKTHALLPPPDKIRSELGEERYPKYTPVGIYCGEEIEYSTLEVNDLSKDEQRSYRAKYTWEQVVKNYETLQQS